MSLLAIRATPEQYLNRQPQVQAIEQPVQVAQVPEPIYIIIPQQNNTYTILIVVVAGLFIIGALGIVAIALLSRR